MRQQLSLAQALAQRAEISRREAVKLIDSNQVMLDGKKCSSVAVKVADSSIITVNGKKFIPPKITQEVIVYHKPLGELCSRPAVGVAKRNVFDSLPEPETGKWIMVGRLDINTSGLLLFTNDGNLAYKLMHPKYQLDREYIARVSGRQPPTQDTLNALKKGFVIDGEPARFNDVVPMHMSRKMQGKNYYFHLVVQEGRNRLVRRLWEKAGFSVSRLRRVRFANISLPQDLPSGKFIHLNKQDRRRLAACVAH